MTLPAVQFLGLDVDLEPLLIPGSLDLVQPAAATHRSNQEVVPLRTCNVVPHLPGILLVDVLPLDLEDHLSVDAHKSPLLTQKLIHQNLPRVNRHNHQIQKLSRLLNPNCTHLNVTNLSVQIRTAYQLHSNLLCPTLLNLKTFQISRIYTARTMNSLLRSIHCCS